MFVRRLRNMFSDFDVGFVMLIYLFIYLRIYLLQYQMHQQQKKNCFVVFYFESPD